MATLAGGHAGVSRYTAALARALDRVGGEFGALDLHAVATPAAAEMLGLQNIPVSRSRLPGGAEQRGPGRLLLEQAVSRRGSADLVHFFDLIGPLLSRRRFTATVHDASVAHGFEFTRLRRWYKRPVQPWALRHAEAVVAVSGFARDEAVARLGGDSGRIHVIHSGPGLLAEGGGTAPESPTPFLLFVGSLADNKNLAFLVRAFDAADVEADLVLAGRRGSAIAELDAAVAAARTRDRIRVVEPDDAELDRLYRSALALVHPSMYEGFGFTPLEAMARDTPALVSDIPALREVSGDGALVLPLDEAAWSDAIRRIVADEGLRADLRRRGAHQVSRYSWDETARRLCELFLRVG